MAQNSSYLLTGETGFLGLILSKVLAENGFIVKGFKLFSEPLKADISSPFIIKKDLNVDAIIHAAGKAHIVPRNPEEEKAFFDVNFEGTKNLCAALDQLNTKPKSFIFISTVSVYGLDSGSLITEDHPLKGKTPYAKSKILAEEWLADWAKSNGVKLCILRVPLIAGINPPGNLGAMINGIKSGKYLSIGKATARKSIVWAEDIARVIPNLVDVEGIFNLTDGIHPSFGELEEVISQALGKKKPFSIPIIVGKLLGKVGDILGRRFPINSDKLNKITSTLTFDDARARNVLDWKPSSVLNKMSETLKLNE
ncbi:MAG TPA: NAD-dependent epimerase/dehydratase family protein [Pedobacter sp.]|nr:NAD-dependent epimerase/dehydratase family protein [Pedobacter sp.]